MRIGVIFFIIEKLIAPGDAGETVNNFLAGGIQFHKGIAYLFIVAFLDVGVAWVLYTLLEPASKIFSCLRVVPASVFSYSQCFYVQLCQWIAGFGWRYMTSVETDQLQADVMFSLRRFDDGWAIGLVFFGIHLVILGYLALRSNYFSEYWESYWPSRVWRTWQTVLAGSYCTTM